MDLVLHGVGDRGRSAAVPRSDYAHVRIKSIFRLLGMLIMKYLGNFSFLTNRLCMDVAEDECEHLNNIPTSDGQRTRVVVHRSLPVSGGYSESMVSLRMPSAGVQ
jgi:hypothetical protein